jgi:hypothetical protein
MMMMNIIIITIMKDSLRILSNNLNIFIKKVLFLEPLCGLQKDEGNLTSLSIQWYYDSSIGHCVPFIYKGMGGNMNRFTSKDMCEIACEND